MSNGHLRVYHGPVYGNFNGSLPLSPPNVDDGQAASWSHASHNGPDVYHNQGHAQYQYPGNGRFQESGPYQGNGSYGTPRHPHPGPNGRAGGW